MEHFSMEKWIDFARGVVGAQEKSAMQNHLESGCKKCSQAVSLWQRVHQAARQEPGFEPPQNIVRSIKGTFVTHGPRPQRRSAPAIAKLLFDSAMSPAPVGVRSTAATARQLLFGVGTYRIDLRMEPQLDSDKVAVIGQVLHSSDPEEGLGALPVALVKGRKVVAETITSQFGEFNLECDLDGHFHLRVRLPAEELQLALIDPMLPPGSPRPLTYDPKEVGRMVRKKPKSTRKRT